MLGAFGRRNTIVTPAESFLNFLHCLEIQKSIEDCGNSGEAPETPFAMFDSQKTTFLYITQKKCQLGIISEIKFEIRLTIPQITAYLGFPDYSEFPLFSNFKQQTVDTDRIAIFFVDSVWKILPTAPILHFLGENGFLKEQIARNACRFYFQDSNLQTVLLKRQLLIVNYAATAFL